VEKLVCREYRPEDTADVLEVRNPIFGPLSAEDWDRFLPEMTAGLAYLGDEPVGAIPLHQRDFVLAPGLVVPVAFENAVGVKEEYRSHGIGTAIIEAARQFMADRCDLLMVYRGGERSPGYRFYHKSGHRDLLYVREACWQPPGGMEGEAKQTDVQVLCDNQEQILRAYNATYARYGGHAPRYVGYWPKSIDNPLIVGVPTELLFYRYPADGEILAYGIFGIQHKRGYEPAVRVLEIASRNGPWGVEQVLKSAAAQTCSRDAAMIAYVSTNHPYRYLYRKLGFVEQRRSLNIMGQVIAPRRLFKRVCRCPELLADLKINVWTPSRDYVLFEGPAANREITLEAKDIIIERLLTCRLDIMAAYRQNLLTIWGGDGGVAARLAEAVPFSPWCHHHLDWI